MKKEKRDTVLNIRVPKRLKNDIKTEADVKGITISDVSNDRLDYENRNQRKDTE